MRNDYYMMDMDQLMNRFYNNNMIGWDQKGLNRTPICDVRETENNVIAVIEIPGADKENIDLNVTRNEIGIKADRKQEESDDEGYSYSRHKFFRRIPLSADVDSRKAKARYKDGLLHIEVPKSDDSNASRIQID